MSPSLAVLLGFVSWALLLLVLMEAIRSKLVLAREVPANGFNPGNSNLSPFMQRLARAHANCLEGIPIFGGLLLIAAVSDKTHVTDPTAPVFLAARLVQSLVHLTSTSSAAVMVRFTAFAIQMALAVYWAVKLYAS